MFTVFSKGVCALLSRRLGCCAGFFGGVLRSICCYLRGGGGRGGVGVRGRRSFAGYLRLALVSV